MLIGLVSDTHRQLTASLPRLLAGCDLILHAGDIGPPSLLAELGLVAPVLAVLGNNDQPGDHPSLPRQRRLELEGVSVFLTHQPLDVERHLRACTGRDGAPTLPDVCVHGHTHVPQDGVAFGVRVICPGSASRPRGGSRRSAALLTLSAGRVAGVRFVELT